MASTERTDLAPGGTAVRMLEALLLIGGLALFAYLLLMLDEKRVIVEPTQISLIKALKDWGFQPIPTPF